MCKLCRTERPPQKRIHSEDSKKIQGICNDYLGENACKQCRDRLCDASHTYGTSYDTLIINRLFKKYYSTTESRKAIVRYNSNISNRKSLIIHHLMGIHIITNKSTGHQSFSPTVNNIIIPGGPFSSFQDALDTKIRYMQENGHVKGLKRLTTKLKELQNES